MAITPGHTPVPADDSTVMLPPPGNPPAQSVEITYPAAAGGQQTARFTGAFQIGRGQDCPVRISDERVSRRQLEVYREGKHWWVRDLGSQNGTYLNGKPIRKVRLDGGIALELGRGGPVIHLHLLAPAPSSAAGQPAADISQRYFDPSYSGPVGEHTLMVRRAFQEIARKQSRHYWGIIGLVIVLLLGAGSVAVYQHLKLRKASELAIDIFYNMKTLELQVANLEATLSESARAAHFLDIAARKQQLAELRKRYEDFVAKTGLAGQGLREEDRLILQVARLFGECEINMPTDFVDEVKRYIDKWKTTPRLENAIRRLAANNYAPTIYRAMTANQVPPQFLYLALQESNFQEQIVGPGTRYGFAKGMWQFIPDTGLRYGLRPGPLRELGEYDPKDDRHDFEKATTAAANYIRDIYRTDAQASGMLVMASYNWGEGNVIRLIRQMPENPRERNFWQLLKHYKIPQETYDYVFYIFAAAVIGENPRLFGFGFENPLKNLAAPTGSG
jgi:membrane-bound lytic murein transglycosylase D